ncbi:DsbA family protein [Candidatus Nitrospira inopinata]|uniref:Putative Oxidoreductase, DsbA-like n=1 Tax=Candidatus Nitrospira inopinata TaxID=1715989 RepID=A0A0S4KV88_9BACT|nr:DsbA family protein [Candidatus Nitrospira inopinata]CUQ68005.1 putative Oxidoreductase, DsbA-like [Candidatus Nitrospira inopinata]
MSHLYIWSRVRFGMSVCAALALFASGCSTTADQTKKGSASSHDLADAVIERYIRAHPEVIVQSLQAMEAKRRAELQERQRVALATKQDELLHDPSSPVSGNPKGEITLVEFYDYRCGYCKRAASAVTQLQKEDPRVRVVYKDFPILGEPSELAAKAALASQAQGKHRVFHEALLASHADMTKDEILKIAAGVGLDVKRLEADMADPQWQAIIDKNRALAEELGISGTPGFIVGTELVPGMLDLDGLKELIVRAGHQK